MKTKLFTPKYIAVAVAALSMPLIGISTSSAQDLYQVELNAVSISTNSEGRLIYKDLGNRDLIRETADEQGITNLTGLSLVYNREASDIEVVSGTNFTVISTPLTFSGGVSLIKTNGTEGQLLEYVYVNTNQVASGTLAAGENFRYGSTNQITDFILQGQLQLATTDAGTNGPAIYLGNLFVQHQVYPVPVKTSTGGWR